MFCVALFDELHFYQLIAPAWRWHVLAFCSIALVPMASSILAQLLFLTHLGQYFSPHWLLVTGEYENEYMIPDG